MPSGQKAEDEIAVLLKERQKLYRYQPDSPQIGVLTEELKKLRHTVKLCRNIETHSIEMEQRLQAAQQEEQQRQEKQTQEEKNKQTRNRENQKKEMILSIKFPQENRWNSSADNILSEPASS